MHPVAAHVKAKNPFPLLPDTPIAWPYLLIICVPLTVTIVTITLAIVKHIAVNTISKICKLAATNLRKRAPDGVAKNTENNSTRKAKPIARQ